MVIGGGILFIGGGGMVLIGKKFEGIFWSERNVVI